MPDDTVAPRVLSLPPDDPDTRIAFDGALELAGPTGSVVLFDRSLESWRSEDVAALQDARDPVFDELSGIAEARDLSVGRVDRLEVWRSVTPALGTAVLDAIQHADISDIVLPQDGHSEAVSDVVLGSDTSLASAVRSILDKPLSREADASPTLHLTPRAEDAEQPPPS